jgi:hypothetical protein
VRIAKIQTLRRGNRVPVFVQRFNANVVLKPRKQETKDWLVIISNRLIYFAPNVSGGICGPAEKRECRLRLLVMVESRHSVEFPAFPTRMVVLVEQFT